MGMSQKPLAIRRETRSRLIADEQPAAELLLKRPDSGADRFLGEMQPVCRRDEAARGRDLKERTCKINVHRTVFASKFLLAKQKTFVSRGPSKMPSVACGCRYFTFTIRG
jgi:hypothetical protein